MSMVTIRRTQLKYYTAALLVIMAAILTLGIRPYFEGRAPLFIFTLAVLFAAGYGGTGPGLLATALSLGIAVMLFRDHVLVMAQSSLSLFGMLSLAVSIVLGRLHHVNQLLSRTQSEL